MTRKDIRRGTGLVLIFAVTCTVLIFTMAFVRQARHDGAPAADGDKMASTHWSDSLTNRLSDSPELKGLDAEMQRFIDKWSIKGMQLAVTRNDSLLYTKGYGWADMEAGERMSPKNILRLASASKLVTAVAVMRLAEEGKLTLQSKVFGPDGILNDTLFTNAINDRRLFDVTVDHLLSHQAGFGLGAGDPMFNTKDIIAARKLQGPPDNRQLAAIVLGRKIAFTPGCGHRYSNFGYMLLSLVIERVSGMKYWDFVRENVLEPAGCWRFRPATNYYAERNADEVRYYGPDNEPVEEFNGSGRLVNRVYGGSNVNGLMGAGGWCASASDMARLVAAIDKYPRVTNILSDASVDSLTVWSEKVNRARGWGEILGEGKWRRTGTLSSTHTLVERFPDGECWVLITNSGVWTGHHFSRTMSSLVARMRSAYSDRLPRRDLFSPGVVAKR